MNSTYRPLQPGAETKIDAQAALPVEIAIRSEFGWRRSARSGIELWTKGYGRVEQVDSLLTRIAALTDDPQPSDVARIISNLDGHFSVAARGPRWAFAAVDWVRSIPLAWASGRRGWVIDDQAERLRKTLGLEDVDRKAALALGMAGYTIDVSTLYEGVHQLGPGELVLFAGSHEPRRYRYHCYRPWRSDKPAYDPVTARKSLAELTLAVVDRMMNGLGDRILAVPLSAGRDSRLIVSAARYLGYRNIRAFTYGRRDTHEAKAAQAIAERLGLTWRFVPTDVASMRRYYESSVHAAYYAFADTLQSAPFVQDLLPISILKTEGFVPADAVIANGNSGDYISGAHIIPEMQTVANGLSEDARLARITAALFQKHFSLWAQLETSENQVRIEQQLRASLTRAGATFGDPAEDFGLYEYAEFQDRQCKYVITGQRIYEFLGHEWRLPLWDKPYLDFFEQLPLAGKVGQHLYADMLVTENWGSVWQDIPVNAKTVRPQWIRPLRAVAKLAHAPLGRNAWHQFEKRYLQYWMETGSHSAIRSYVDVARDRRGARSGISWLTECYLEMHGLAFDGQGSVANV